MDNSENVIAFDIQAKLNSIIERTYHCVVDQKKKKKLSHNTRKNYSQASWEGLDTYKYSDYPESGISPQQHVPPAGLPAAGPPAAAAGPPAAAAAHPAGGVAGGLALTSVLVGPKGCNLGTVVQLYWNSGYDKLKPRIWRSPGWTNL